MIKKDHIVSKNAHKKPIKITQNWEANKIKDAKQGKKALLKACQMAFFVKK